MGHVQAMRSNVMWSRSKITIFVEHNLGFEAEHHERALKHLPGVVFYRDEQRQRVGILTTLQVKHAMCTLTNALLREVCNITTNTYMFGFYSIPQKRAVPDGFNLC